MEGYKAGAKWSWKPKTYERLDATGAPTGSRHRRHINKAELGNGRRRFWRIRISPRLRILRRLASPKRILARIRDAYVRLMLSFAGSGVFAGGYGYGGEAVAAFGRPQMKEYDKKMLVEIYKSIIAQDHLFAAAGNKAIAKVEVRG